MNLKPHSFPPLPAINLHLPDGDERIIKKRFVQYNEKGELDICINVSDKSDATVKDLAQELADMYSAFADFADKVDAIGRRNLKVV